MKTFMTLILAALATAGCGAAVMDKYDVRDDLEEWRAEHAAIAKERDRQETIEVALVGSPSLAMTISGVKPEGFPLTPVPGGAGDEDVEEAYEKVLKDSKQFGILWKGGGDAMAEILRGHLERYFKRASVKLVAQPPPGTEMTVNASLKFTTGMFSRGVDMGIAAAGPDGRKLAAKGTPETASSAPHLAWAIPVMLATGVWVGIAIVGPAFRSINKGIEERKYVEALDLACADLARQIASQHAKQGVSGQATALR